MRRYVTLFVVAFVVAMSVTMLVSTSQAAEVATTVDQVTQSPFSGWASELMELASKLLHLIILGLGGIVLKKLGANWDEDTKLKAMQTVDRLAGKAAGAAEEWAADKVKAGITKAGDEKLDFAATKLSKWTGKPIEECKEELQAALPFLNMGATKPPAEVSSPTS